MTRDTCSEPALATLKDWALATVKTIAVDLDTELSGAMWGGHGESDKNLNYHLLLHFGNQIVPVLVPRKDMDDLSSPDGKRSFVDRMRRLLSVDPWVIWTESGSLSSVRWFWNSSGQKVAAIGFYVEGQYWMITEDPHRAFSSEATAIDFLQAHFNLETGRPKAVGR